MVLYFIYTSFLSFQSWYFQIVILDYYRIFYNIYWASTWKWIYVTVNCYQKTMDNAFILRSAHNIINGCIIYYYYYSQCNFRYFKRVLFSFNLWKIEYEQYTFRRNVIWKYSNLSDVLFTIHSEILSSWTGLMLPGKNLIKLQHETFSCRRYYYIFFKQIYNFIYTRVSV